jgi:uncharacterized OB-fold protein
MTKPITSVQCTRCGHEVSLASSTHMYVVKRHKCQRCGKAWFPRTPGTPKICPTCKTTNWHTPKKEGKVHANRGEL